MSYIVQVTHMTGSRRRSTNPMLLTNNPAVALTAAIAATEYGFEFPQDGDGVQVFRLPENSLLAAEPWVDGNGQPAPTSLVFYRIRDSRAGDGWLTVWSDQNLESMYRKVIEDATV